MLRGAMSADNYYMIRKAPSGKHVAVMGFYSDPVEPVIDPAKEYQEFDEAMDAWHWANDQQSEYGVSIHPECEVRKISKSDE